MTSHPAPHQQLRQAAMAVLVRASAIEIEALVGALALPQGEDLRQPENGLVMVRGRIGGDGAAFHLGEATVSRAAVRLDDGAVGYGYTLGRDRHKARLIALCDALLQTDHADEIETQVLAPLRAGIAADNARRAEQTAATKVDFYTLVRGE
ncbi:phosphonate C-P lyase system protein PhnG [Rhodopseudomonas palustris]